MTLTNAISTSPSRLAVTIVAAVMAVGTTMVIADRYVFRPTADEGPAAAPVVAQPAPATRDRDPLATARKNVDDLASMLAGASRPQAPNDNTPAFDIARIEPTGEAVIAGRAAPGATVELLRNGEPLDRAVADQGGQFAMVPPPLPRGTYDLTLRARLPDGTEATSKQSVAVALEGTGSDKPVVALMSPDKPTVVLSRPAAAAPTATAAVTVEAVDMQPGGKVHVSGRAAPGAEVRLYLNDSFVTSVTAGPDGRLAVTINQGVAPGNYRVRLDAMEQGSTKVVARAEVPFDVPDVATTASVAQPPASPVPANAAQEQTQVATAAPAASPDAGSPSSVVVPKIATVTVSRGDSLWRISRRALGDGTRYALVFKSNRAQIRDPNLIYPGQVFVVPAAGSRP